MALDIPTATITIFVTEHNTSFEAAIRASAPSFSSRFVFQTTPNSLAQLQDVTRNLTDAAADLTASGIDWRVMGPDIRAGVVKVAVVGLTDKERDDLVRRFGPTITAVNISEVEAPVPFDRQNDTAPFNGGDFISDNVGDCTSGFPVHNGTPDYYMITAAHCFNLGSTVYNKSVTIPLGSGPAMGNVSNRDTTSGGLDAELIYLSHTSGSSLIWTGGTATQNPVRSVVSGAKTSPVGYQVCADGAFEGTHCSLTIQANGVTISLNGRTVSSQVYVTSSDPQAAGNGDSGGPVYRFSGSSLYGVGVISGGASTPSTCVNWYPQTTRSCYSSLYYADLGPILAKWGLANN